MARPTARRRPPKPAHPLVLGYVPTTVHAHRPSPQIPARSEPLLARRVPPAEQTRGPSRTPPSTRGPAVGDGDPVDGFLAALRRHLSEPSEADPALDVTAEEHEPPPTPHENDTAEEPTLDVTAQEHEPPRLPDEDDTAEEPTRPVPRGDTTADPHGETPGTRPEPATTMAGSEHGDRGRFLATARVQLAGGVPTNVAHPPPSPRPLTDVDDPAPVPEPTYGNLDRDDVVGSFVRALEEAGGVCHQVAGDVPDALLDHLVAELNAWDVVVSAEPEAVALGERLAGRGVDVGPATAEAAARATVGVTSAVAAIAATGSVVLDSRRAGGRLASLLPAVHLCLLSVERLVATPGDLLRSLGADPGGLPPRLVIETGPAHKDDIEQIFTVGAHGPTRLHVILVS